MRWKQTTSHHDTNEADRLQVTVRCYVKMIIELNLENKFIVLPIYAQKN